MEKKQEQTSEQTDDLVDARRTQDSTTQHDATNQHEPNQNKNDVTRVENEYRSSLLISAAPGNQYPQRLSQAC